MSVTVVGLVKDWPATGVERETVGTTAGVGVVSEKPPVVPPLNVVPLSIMTL